MYALITNCFFHIHSPIGEVFRSRLRQFPSLVTCCTIDWFSEWPDEALKSVASSSLNELTEIDNTDAIEGLVRTNITKIYIRGNLKLNHFDPYIPIRWTSLPYISNAEASL